jgi:hypothetical protein
VSGGRPLGWIAAGVVVHLLFLAGLFAEGPRLFFNDASHTRRGFDFAVYYLAGQAFAAGEDVYGVEGGFGFRYLPAFAYTVGRFFALFPPRAAYLVYLLCTELLLLANLWLTWRWTQEPGRRGVALFMWLAFTPFFLELYMGQVSFWAASLLFWLLGALSRGDARAAALTLSGAALIKPNALILAPALLALGQYRVLAACALALFLTSVPYFLVHPQGWSAFLDLNLGQGHFQGALTHAGNLGLVGGLVSLCAKVSGLPLASLSALSDLPLWGRFLVHGVQAAVLASALLASFALRPWDPIRLLCLWLTTYFLLYKDVWEHHYVFLLPVLIALYVRTPSPKLLYIFIFLALPTPFFLFDVQPGAYGPIDPERHWSLPISLLYRSFKLIPTLALWLWLCRKPWIEVAPSAH